MRTTAALLALCLTACASVPLRDDTAAIDASREQMSALVAKESIPGAAIAVTVGDRMAWHDTFGVTDLGTKAPVRMETRFRVGSVSKMLTVAGLLRLVDQGHLRLDDPVSKYLPDYPHGAITLRQLAAHLSGIRHYGPGEFINTTRYTSATDSLRKFANDRLISQPGEQVFYSTYGYNVLGAVIEKVTGKTFDAAMSDLVYRPLRMEATSSVSDAATTSFYDASKEGPVVAPVTDLSDRMPAGGAVTSARDLARLLIAMSSESFLSAQSRAHLLVPQKTTDGKPTNVGIGWRIATDPKGRTFLHHGGAVTGGRAFVLFYPKERVGVSIVTNLGYAAFNEKEAGAIAARFLPE